MRSTTYESDPAPLLASRTVTYCTENEWTPLLAVFAARGLGVFPVSRLGADDIGLMRGLRLLGSSDGVTEEIHAIRSRRGQHHPLVQKLMTAAAAHTGA